MLEIKNIVTEMKNIFDELISKIDMAEGRISELKDISIKPPELKSKENKD